MGALRLKDLEPSNDRSIDRNLETRIRKLHVAASLLEGARRWNRNGQPSRALADIRRADSLIEGSVNG